MEAAAEEEEEEVDSEGAAHDASATAIPLATKTLLFAGSLHTFSREFCKRNLQR